MMTTKQAIESRRSIRKFKPDPVPDSIITKLLDAARLAPSGCNAQPWRFKVIKHKDDRKLLAQTAYGQSFIAEAPVVFVCCADIKGYLKGSVSGIQDIGKIRAIDRHVVQIIRTRTKKLEKLKTAELAPRVAFNVAIAVEHIVLRALDFGLGTCWVRLFDEIKVREIFEWDENIHVVTLLPVGYPNESPGPRKRKSIRDLMIQ
jgi:nitroreductase